MTLEPFNYNTSKNEEYRLLQRQQSSVRMYMLMVLFIAGFIAVAMKLFVIQVRDSEKLQELARIQYESRESIKPMRGLILDRNLSILASNVTEYLLAVDPAVIEDRDSVARVISAALNRPLREIRSLLSDTTRRYVVVQKRLPEEAAATLKGWDYYGVKLRPSPRRRYNFQALAGPLIGYTNVDNKGQSGIELEMDRELSGHEGFIVYQRDARGSRRPEVDYPKVEPVNGRSVVLTISQVYQSIAEEELSKGVELYAAESGRCIVLQPRTGEILAMANYPSIDPNKLQEYTPEKARNRAVTDLYEPGSTFKIVAMSAALNEGLYEPDDVINAENGRWVYNPKLKPIVDDHPYAQLTLRGAFEHSSNIVSAKLANKLGDERFYKYARNYGFGVKTGIELPGEISGDLKKPLNWDGTTLNLLAFGYGLAVTSLQIACAYAAIANDGVLMRPFIRKWLLDENRNIVEENTPQVVRRVVSPETSHIMRSFMKGVVDSGTARLASIEGVSIGGKTGTSQRLVNGSYSNKSHVASFVGFFPVEDPKVLILVILDAPSRGYYGGTTAGPIFRNIAMRIINSSSEFAKRPEPLYASFKGNDQVRVPNVRGMNRDVAEALLKAHGLNMHLTGKGERVASQSPSDDRMVRRRSIVTLHMRPAKQEQAGAMVRVPNVIGMSLRQAMAYMKSMQLTPSPMGSGIVRAQYPEPGEMVPSGSRCTINADAEVISANLY
ncbi:MAG: penicillin-binding transpeptidase domain-containing protein [Bacteroidia bacterium]|nr:penicillin-binding transpeptidase domain-containing protein [Bacteroidia bacterium]